MDTDAPAAAAVKAQQKAEDLQRATEAGWQKPIPFEYGGAGDPDAGAEESYQEDVKWLSDAVVYEWADDYGDVGPENLALEKELFNDPDMQRHGNSFRIYDSFEVNIDGSEKIQPFRSVSQP